MKTIEITDDAYHRLMSNRRGGETISGVILRGIKDKELKSHHERNDTSKTIGRFSPTLYNSSQFGGEVVGYYKPTKEDLRDAKEMYRRITREMSGLRKLDCRSFRWQLTKIRHVRMNSYED